MKKYFLLAFLFLSTVQLHAQEKTETPITVETVSKKWVFFDIINSKISKEEYQENKEMLEDAAIEFRKDMTFTFTFIVDLSGTWKVDKNIITTTDRRGETTWTIHKINENEIIMSRNKSEQKVIFKSN